MSFLDLSMGFGMGTLAGIAIYNFFIGWKLRQLKQPALPSPEPMSDEDIDGLPNVNEEVTESIDSVDLNSVEIISEDKS